MVLLKSADVEIGLLTFFFFFFKMGCLQGQIDAFIAQSYHLQGGGD